MEPFVSINQIERAANSDLYITALYAKCTPKERRELWSSLELTNLQVNGPWCIGGDFNVILDPDEKKGGRPHRMNKSLEFSTCIDNCGMMDLDFVGPKYTWCSNWEARRRIWKRLDRVVEEVWRNHVNGNPLWRLQQKLKMLSRRLTQWSKEDIGNVFDQVHYWENKMKDLEQSDLKNNNDITRTELNKGQAEYIRWMGMQDDILKQKARVNWFEEGDANTKYFHSTIRDRRRRLQIQKIKDHRGHWIEGDSNIGKTVVLHFQQFFNINHHFNDQNIINGIPQCVIGDDNEILTATPDTEEIRDDVFNMSSTSATGPEGYSGKFFQTCWDIIKEDITDFVQAVFNCRRLTKFFSHTCLVLIPKVDSPSSFSNLRPISLSKFTAKIISKILSRRLNPILGKLISENQSGFVKGRLITENILQAQEIAQGVNKKNRGGNVIIKLDMAKAYDRISWTFLMAVMRKFGYSENWIDIIWGLLQGI
ncbi:PREDICTED: uncharacterized protein LOC109205471 [Nicotiana attenuata]|uniref:uncharacterized protein LOC109205471 n=1 Tax=Nicotiana attenuata TaxID=49451 RepID=UPI000904C443|nr:PREDICTED: uncharacterized protein LOC109205471 [Nicotiana attenuata]